MTVADIPSGVEGATVSVLIGCTAAGGGGGDTFGFDTDDDGGTLEAGEGVVAAPATDNGSSDTGRGSGGVVVTPSSRGVSGRPCESKAYAPSANIARVRNTRI